MSTLKTFSTLNRSRFPTQHLRMIRRELTVIGFVKLRQKGEQTLSLTSRLLPIFQC
jgi:hypothetical protein